MWQQMTLTFMEVKKVSVLLFPPFNLTHHGIPLSFRELRRGVPFIVLKRGLLDPTQKR